MVSTKPIAVVALISVLLLGAVGPVAAHGWQTTVEQGEMELGVSSTPETPVAGMATEFAARIKDSNPSGDADRLDWGGVTNQSVEIHVRGPDGFHDHVKAEIPEDGAHFHWNYRFPTDGNYTMAVVTKMEGQKYAFQFQKNVTLLPAKATGEELAHMSEELHGVSKSVSATNEDVSHVHEKVDSLQSQVEELSGQIDALKEQQATDDHDEGSSAALSNMGLGAALVGLAGVAAFVAGRRI